MVETIGFDVRRSRKQIEISNVSHTYGKKLILDNLAFSIAETGLTKLTGKNGVGKTTLLRCLGGMFGNAHSVVPSKTSFVYLDRDSLTLDFLDVEEMMRLARSLGVVPTYGESGYALVSDFLKSPVRTLSIGQQARLVLAMAANMQANVILLDEPFNGLDDEGRRSAYQLLQDIAEQCHVIFSTHEEDLRDTMNARELKLVDSRTIIYG